MKKIIGNKGLFILLIVFKQSFGAEIDQEAAKTSEVPLSQEAPQPIIDKAPEAIAKEGVDTVDIEEGGNWLLKRKALEDTVDLIEQIGRTFTQIIEASMDFRIKYNQLNNEYDHFIGSIGFDLGDTDQLLSDLAQSLENERKKESDLTEQERELENAVAQKQKEVAQLQESLKKLRDLDAKIVNVLTIVDQQVQVGNTYQNQAWKNFQTIKKVLSDEKAEAFFYNTQGLFKNIQATYHYLKETLSAYFMEQSAALRNEISLIKNQVESLKKIGIDLKKSIEKNEQEDQEREKKSQEEEMAQVLEKKVEELEKEYAAKNKTGLWHSLRGYFNAFINGIVAIINIILIPFKKLFGFFN